MLTLTHLSLATTEQLFRYKHSGFELEAFPGYSDDQWGIKAHNRPWIAATGAFEGGQRVIEVGGAYSTLPKYLAHQHGLEAWIGDDFGGSDESMWSRWGNPRELPSKHPSVNYVFAPFGSFDQQYPDRHFDRIFSVSTLEHIPHRQRVDVFKDMNRCLRAGGKQLHTIDLSTDWRLLLVSSAVDCVPGLRNIRWRGQSEIRSWIGVMKASGIQIDARALNPIRLFDRRLLVESPDVVYRFYPPNDQPKPYKPASSLLVIIEDR